MGIVIIDFINKIVDVLSVYMLPAVLIAAVPALIAKFIFKKSYGIISFFVWIMFCILIFCETVIRRIGLFKETTDWIGIKELFENPWFIVSSCENVIMFMPCGFFFCLAFRKLDAGKRFWINVLFTLILSVSVEVIQFQLQIGEAQVLDVITNIIGCMIGYGVAGALTKRYTN